MLVYNSIEKDQESQDSKYQQHKSVKTSPVTFLRKRNVKTKWKLTRLSRSRKSSVLQPLSEILCPVRWSQSFQRVMGYCGTYDKTKIQLLEDVLFFPKIKRKMKKKNSNIYLIRCPVPYYFLLLKLVQFFYSTEVNFCLSVSRRGSLSLSLPLCLFSVFPIRL